jgi:predicted transcriptional regulator
MKKVFFACLLLLVFSFPAHSGERELPPHPEISPEMIAQNLGELWYGMYMGKTKLGYVQTAICKEAREGRESYICKENVVMLLAAMGQKTEMRVESEKVFAAQPPYALLSSWNSENTGRGAKKVFLSGKEGNFEAKIEEAGQTRTRYLGAIDYTLADLLAPNIWILAKPKPGEVLPVLNLDYDELRLLVDSYTVISLKHSLVGGVKAPFYEVKYASEKMGDLGVARIDPAGKVCSMVLGGLFEARLEPEDIAKKIEYGQDLFLFGSVPLNAAIGDPKEITSLVLEARGEGAAKLESAACQQATWDEARKVTTLRLGKEFGQSAAATEEEIADNLRETVEYPITQPEVKELAQKAIGNAVTEQEKVANIVKFVSDFIEDDYHSNPPTVLDIIRVRKGDCSEHSLLFAALARSCGIPTRQIGGLIYMGDEMRAFAWHAWDEVVLDGKWVPVDATWNETEINATHIRVGAGKEATMLSVLGKLELAAVSVNNKEIEIKPFNVEPENKDEEPAE